MARDWRKVALAVLAAAALASVCPDLVEAQQTRKAPAKAKAAKSDSDGGENAAKKRQDPAEAQRAVENASKLLQSGKADQAEHVLSATLAGGSLPPAIMARALYLRGTAYRHQKKPAQAISDFTSALWLKGGLSSEDRAEALKQRSAAYADAGLTETGAIASAGSGTSANVARTESAPQTPKTWGTVTTPSVEPSGATQTSQAGGNWFKNWFNAWGSPGGQTGGTSTASISKEEAAPERVAQTAPTARISSAWSSNTEVKRAAVATPAHGPSPAPSAGGKYRVQLATVRTQREAQALAAKAKAALGADREPEIDQTVLGNMGSFYRVRVGPFATAQDAQAVCAKVKGTGFDCMTVTQ